MLLAFACFVVAAACDDPTAVDCYESPAPKLRISQPAGEAAADVAFRGGPPWHQVIVAPRTLEEFMKIAAACPDLGALPLTISASGYDSDPDSNGSQQDEVLGLGFSAMVTPALRGCVQDVMAEEGAVFY